MDKDLLDYTAAGIKLKWWAVGLLSFVLLAEPVKRACFWAYAYAYAYWPTPTVEHNGPSYAPTE